MKIRFALAGLPVILFATLIMGGAQVAAEVPASHNVAAGSIGGAGNRAAADAPCAARAEDPFVLTSTSRNIHALGVVIGCTWRPDNCRLQVDLEQFNGDLGFWTTVAHKDSGWKAGCRRAWWGGYPRVDTVYTCTHDNDVQWGYRTVIYFQVEENGEIANDRAESTNDKLFWCF